MYQVRPFQRGEEEEIVDVIEHAFGTWPFYDIECSPLDHWKWKHLDNPIKDSLINVAVSNGKIVGCYHADIQRLFLKGDTILWGDGVDACVNPDYRKMGIYNKLLDYTFNTMRENSVVYWRGFTVNPILIETLSKRYPYFPNLLQNLFHVSDINLHLQKKATSYSNVKKLGFKTLILYRNIQKRILEPRINDSINVKTIKRFDENIDTFWEKIVNDYDCIQERSQQYLNWRYCDPRGGSYQILLAEKNGSISGFAILRINKKQDYWIGYIVDILTLTEEVDLMSRLIDSAIQYFKENDVNETRIWFDKNIRTSRVLNSRGFLKNQGKVHLFYVPLCSEDNLKLLKGNKRNKLHFTYGDTDLI